MTCPSSFSSPHPCFHLANLPSVHPPSLFQELVHQCITRTTAKSFSSLVAFAVLLCAHTAFASLPLQSGWAVPHCLGGSPVALPCLLERYLSSASLFYTPAGSSWPPSSCSPFLPNSFCSWGSCRNGWWAAGDSGGSAWYAFGASVAGWGADSGSGGQSGSGWSFGSGCNSGSGRSSGCKFGSGSCRCTGCRCGSAAESCYGAGCGCWEGSVSWCPWEATLGGAEAASSSSSSTPSLTEVPRPLVI